MKRYLDDDERAPVDLATGCLKALVLIILLLIGSCAFIRISEAQELRADLPPQLEPSLFIDVDVCSRMFGGYSYVVRISSEAVQNLERKGQPWLAPPKGYPVDPSKAAPWQSAEGLKWSPDFPPNGLQCLDGWEVDGHRIRDHIFRKGSYYRSYHRRQADYIIPSLGVVVGGFDPR